MKHLEENCTWSDKKPSNYNEANNLTNVGTRSREDQKFAINQENNKTETFETPTSTPSKTTTNLATALEAEMATVKAATATAKTATVQAATVKTATAATA